MEKYNVLDKVVVRLPLSSMSHSGITKEEVLEFFKKEEHKEALYCASTNLFSKYENLMNGQDFSEKETKKLIAALTKYFLRMKYRCTPFALFASNSVVEVGAKGDIQVSTPSNRDTQVDTELALNLAAVLEQHPSIKDKVGYKVNSSLYRVGDQYRNVESAKEKNLKTSKISSVHASEYLSRVVEMCSVYKNIDEISQELADEEVSFRDCKGFVQELILAQVLVSELEVNLTGPEYFDLLMERLRRLGLEHEVLSQLETVSKAKEAIGSSLVHNNSAYQEFYDAVEALGLDLDTSKMLQTDSSDAVVEGTVDAAVLKQLESTVSALSCFTQNSTSSALNRFKEKFYDRYDDNLVPLLEVIDHEMGIGYGNFHEHSADFNVLLSKVAFPGEPAEQQITMDPLSSFLFKKLQKANESKEQQITIDAKELKGLEKNDDSCVDAESFSVHFNMIEEEGRSKLFFGGASNNAANFIGRFTKGNKDLLDLSQAVAGDEEAFFSEKIRAEIVHLADDRSGNVCKRYGNTAYEIPYLAQSTKAEEFQLKLDDLFVTLEGDRVVLKSQRLGKEIVPVLSNMHNYSTGLPMYQFLADLNNQNKRSSVGFHWGSLGSLFSFFPRVEMDNVIVSPATWNLNKVDFVNLVEGEDSKRKESFYKLKEDWNLPESFFLTVYDNKLLVDCSSNLSVEVFLEEISKMQSITLEEHVFEDKKSPFVDASGNAYANECVAFFTAQPQERIMRLESNEVLPDVDFESSFSLGSKWLYQKWYCGSQTSDKLLEEVYLPVVENLKAKGWIEGAFFIRYADPNPHLRVRFLLKDQETLGPVLELLNAALSPWIEEGLLHAVKADTYRREWRRYGAQAMEESEQLFFSDSAATSQFLSMVEGEEGEHLRWMFAMSSIDSLLNDFGVPLEQKSELMNRLAYSFSSEFKVEKIKEFKFQLDQLYRDYTKDMKFFELAQKDAAHEYAPLFEILNARSNKNAPVIQRLLGKDDIGVEIEDLLGSHIHMIMNRLFRNNQRKMELVIYDFLSRKYKSQVAREKFSKKNKLQVTL